MLKKINVESVESKKKRKKKNEKKRMNFLHQKPVVEQLCLFSEYWYTRCGDDELRSLAMVSRSLLHALSREWPLRVSVEARLMQWSYKTACRQGRLDILQYLYLSENESSTRWGTDSSDVIDWAAERGHLQVVQWLHENLKGGCSSAAMDGAAKRGHLHVVQWLHENRSEGCSKEAVYYATKYGHLDVLQWLHAHYFEKLFSNNMYIAELVFSAVERGHFSIVQWLYSFAKFAFGQFVYGRAARGGHLELAKWLNENCTVKMNMIGRAEALSAIRIAAERGHFDMVMWLCANCNKEEEE